MILAGLLLAAAVAAAWPEPSTRIVRLPYGESQPKAPLVAQAQAPRADTRVAAEPAEPAAPPAPPSAPEVDAEPDTEPARVLAAVDPEFDSADGPAPVPSSTELDDDYVQESPEELGADPLPGVDVTQAPPVAG
jgi:hypothetical protein